MATTMDHLGELTVPEPADREAVPEKVRARPAGRVEAPVAAAKRTRFWAGLLEPLQVRWAAIGLVAWAVLFTIGIAVEPAADNPNAVDPWFVDLLGMVLLGAMVGTLAGFWLRRRWGMAASLVGSGILVLSTVMCPVSGHHTGVGAWWVIQLGCGLGLMTTSALGLRRS